MRRSERRDERVWNKILRKERYEKYMRRMKRRDMQRARAKEEKRRRRMRREMRELRRKRMKRMKAQFVREMEVEKRRESAYKLLNKLIASSIKEYGAGSLPKGALKTLATLKGETSEKKEKIDWSRRRRLVDDHGVDGDITMMVRCKMVIAGPRNGYLSRFEVCVCCTLGDRIHGEWSVDLKWMEKQRHNGLPNGSTNGAEHTMTGRMGQYVDKMQLDIHNAIDNELEENVICGGLPSYIGYRMCMEHAVMTGTDDQWDVVLYFQRNDNAENELLQQNNAWEALEDVFHLNDDCDWDETNVIAADGTQWIEKCSHLSIATVCIERFNVSDSRGSIQFVSKRE